MNTQRFLRPMAVVAFFTSSLTILLPLAAGNAAIRHAQAQIEKQNLNAKSTPTSTPTAVSTLTAVASERQIGRLLNDNASCKLPCWWGIEPGISTKADVVQVVSRLNPLKVTISGSQVSEFGESIEVKYSKPLAGRDDQYFYLDGGRVAFIEAATFNAGHTKLQKILATYGEPDVILISAGIPPEDGRWFVSMDMHYVNLGFSIGYATFAQVRGNKLLACFAHRSFDKIGVVTWDVTNVPERVLKNSLAQIAEQTKPLEEVSRETRKSLHRRYSRVGSTYCLPIDADKWGY
jgi:hypothetical protein